MPRTADFNRDKALESAMKLFWAKGYSATALPDLLKAMGIARSSFYASFGGKRELFIECLELFAQRTIDGIDTWQPEQPPGHLPRAFFESTLLEAPQHRVEKGCMMVNSVLELSEVDSELSELASAKLDRVQALFTRAFASAQANGQLPADTDPEQLAQMVMTINFGLRVQSRKSQSPEQLRSLIDNSLAMLGLAA